METDGGFPSLDTALGECRRWIEVEGAIGGHSVVCLMCRACVGGHRQTVQSS